MGVSRSRDRFRSLLDCARERHGELAELLLPVFEEEWRQSDISRRRAEIKRDDHRFFLALLLNVPDRKNVFRLVHERFPEQDSIELIVGWVKELAATRTFGSREPNVLGIGEFNDGHLFVFRRLLEDCPAGEIENQAAAAGITAPIQELVKHIRALPLFKSFFAD